MPFFSRHPDLSTLSEFLALPSGPTRAKVAAHLERCARCRESLQFLRTIAEEGRAPAARPSAQLRDRVLASRAAGARTIIPLSDPGPVRSLRPLTAVAALVAVLAAGSLLIHSGRAEAGTPIGDLTLSPALPRRGQEVRVTYRPAAPLTGHESLRLRARVRFPSSASYASSVPATTLAVLLRRTDGTFTGSFSLPDSAVFAALAVEDSAAERVDDRGGRTWEVLVADASGRPLYDALSQRTQDLMGRNWEDGYATVRRMVSLYPAELRAWDWLHSMQSWLGRGDDDSVRALHRARLAAFDARFSRTPHLAPDTVGEMAWYSGNVDSALGRKWRTRLMREAPGNSFAIQWRLIDILGTWGHGDTARFFHRLDSLWMETPASRAEQVASYGASYAWEAEDTALIRRWTDREMATDRRPAAAARDVAVGFARLPALREEGMSRLRRLIAGLDSLPAAERGLSETMTAQRKRHHVTQRELLAVLGEALVAAGRTRAGLDTLALAAADGWDLEVLRAVHAASLAAGDTADAMVTAAEIAVDPRTDSTWTDSARILATRIVGDSGWSAALRAARRTFAERMLTGIESRTLIGAIPLRDSTGRTRDLRDITRGRVAVVAFWSPECAPAVEDLPNFNAVAARLGRAGVVIVSLVDEASGPSPELAAFLKEHPVTAPLYFDHDHAASRAFNQWGRPDYFVLDADGQVRFRGVNSAEEALAQAEALRLADGG